MLGCVAVLFAGFVGLVIDVIGEVASAFLYITPGILNFPFGLFARASA